MANGTLAVSQLEILTQSGTGIITVVPPTTNTNRTLTLPDVTATVITDSAGILNIGSGQVYKDASGNLLVGATSIATIGGVGSRFQSASNAATTFQWAGSFINTNAVGSYALGVGIKYFFHLKTGEIISRNSTSLSVKSKPIQQCLQVLLSITFSFCIKFIFKK